MTPNQTPAPRAGEPGLTAVLVLLFLAVTIPTLISVWRLP